MVRILPEYTRTGYIFIFGFGKCKELKYYTNGQRLFIDIQWTRLRTLNVKYKV